MLAKDINEPETKLTRHGYGKGNKERLGLAPTSPQTFAASSRCHNYRADNP